VVLRALVFQFIGLASVGAYVNLYRTETAAAAVRRLSAGRSVMTDYASSSRPPAGS